MPSSGKPGSPLITLLLRTLQLLPNWLRVPADLMYWPLRFQGSDIISILIPHWPPAVPTSFLGLPVPAGSTHELHTQALWSEMHSPSCHPPLSSWLTSCLPSFLSIFTKMSPSEWSSPIKLHKTITLVLALPPLISCFIWLHSIFFCLMSFYFLARVIIFRLVTYNIIHMKVRTALGFPDGTSGKELACQRMRHRRLEFDPWVRKIPWGRAWQPIPILLPGEFHGQRSLACYSPRVTQNWTWLKWLSMHHLKHNLHVGEDYFCPTSLRAVDAD